MEADESRWSARALRVSSLTNRSGHHPSSPVITSHHTQTTYLPRTDAQNLLDDGIKTKPVHHRDDDDDKQQRPF